MRHNKLINHHREETVTVNKMNREKLAALQAYHALNRHPEAVTDAVFVGGGEFFDTQDLVQVKYEMLRRVHQEGQSVTQAAAAFGFSRPSFYQAQQTFEVGGLPGLCPQRPGPRRAHKLTPEVVAFLEQVLAETPWLEARDLARRVQECFRVSVHPRSIERSLAGRQKKLRQERP
ncbi:helix-turn-helix domain-containing protein [Dehalococcoidia bacterium]|nr:helix-turn-helix domain-containing protein [Dehalococcoidia bacterium]